MSGIDHRRIRLLPIRSTKTSATSVNTKLVTATTRDVRVGIGNPSIVNIVAEKYIREFYVSNSQKQNKGLKSWGDTHKAAELLESL